MTMRYIVRSDGHFMWIKVKGNKREFPYPPGNVQAREKAMRLAREAPQGPVIDLAALLADVVKPEISGTGEVRDKDGNVRCRFKLG